MILVSTQIRVGMLIKHDGNLCSVLHLEHRTPGNWRGMIHARLRNIKTGSQIEYRYRTDEKVEKLDLEIHEMEFLYADADDCHFMNTENFEQMSISKEILGDTYFYMTPNIKLKMTFYDGRAVGTELPDKVDLEVVETEPALKGATVSNVMKPAKLETGLIVQVPPFISIGERIRVDTRDGEYVERV